VAGFVTVAKLSDLRPGECKAIEVEGKELALFNVEGTIYALDNTCLHQGGPLGEGDLSNGIVTCPWHGWEYDVCTGKVCGDDSMGVATYRVQVEGNEVKVEV
jgi:nitrite reductase (NADH) small subunit